VKYSLLLATIIAGLGCATPRQLEKGADLAPQTVLNLNPGANNPRNSEGDFIELSDGRILFVYTHYYGTSPSDHGSAYLASRISTDRGETWSPTDKIEVENEGNMNIMSVSLLRLQSGQVALFYMRKHGLDDCVPMMRVSDDEGTSWSEATTIITDQGGYYVLNNDRVVQSGDGRIFVPVSRHNTTGGEWTRRGVISCYYSDDGGVSWYGGDEVPNPDDLLLQEPGIIELENDNHLMFMRSDEGTQCFSRSADGGKTWSKPMKSQLISPRSPATIERIPSTGDLLAVWNNNLALNEEEAELRCPLNIAISKDEGVSWEKIKVLENDPDRRYCYTAMHFVDDAVLLAYADGSYSAETHWGLTKMIKVSLPWIYN